MRHFDVIIIGAGASGLMCARLAAQRGRKVLLLDHANKAGKKILMSGGGNCNFTNLYCESDCFISTNPNFCKSALARFTQWDFLQLVEQYRIAYHEKKQGQLFCRNSSEDMLLMLLHECEKFQVTLQLKTKISQISSSSEGYQIFTDNETLECQSLVIATGGLSIPTMGSSAFGYQIASQFGHQIHPTRAALVPLTITDPQLRVLCNELAGSSLNDCIVSCCNISFKDSILFTHRGLSGPAILQISSYWKSGEPIEINWLPQYDLPDWLIQMQKTKPNTELKSLLAEVMTKKIADLFCRLWFKSKPIKQYTPTELNYVANQLSSWKIIPAGTEGYRTAEVTLGGVDTHEISSKTMESKLSPNLYFIGEVLDVTGQLGGFNFQWAWSSAYAAAQYA